MARSSASTRPNHCASRPAPASASCAHERSIGVAGCKHGGRSRRTAAARARTPDRSASRPLRRRAARDRVVRLLPPQRRRHRRPGRPDGRRRRLSPGPRTRASRPADLPVQRAAAAERLLPRGRPGAGPGALQVHRGQRSDARSPDRRRPGRLFLGPLRTAVPAGASSRRSGRRPGCALSCPRGPDLRAAVPHAGRRSDRQPRLLDPRRAGDLWLRAAAGAAGFGRRTDRPRPGVLAGDQRPGATGAARRRIDRRIGIPHRDRAAGTRRRTHALAAPARLGQDAERTAPVQGGRHLQQRNRLPCLEDRAAQRYPGRADRADAAVAAVFRAGTAGPTLATRSVSMTADPSNPKSGGSGRMLVAMFRRYPGRSTGVLFALLIASLLDGVGLSTLLSMISLSSQSFDDASGSRGPVLDASTEQSTPERLIGDMFAWAGIEATLPNLLAFGIALILLKAAVVLLANRQVGYAVAQVATDLRLDLVRAVAASRWRYYLSKSVGSLANAMATEAQRASEGYLHAAVMATQIITAGVYAIVALLISWQVTLGALVLSAILLGGLNLLVRTAVRGAQQRAAQAGDLEGSDEGAAGSAAGDPCRDRPVRDAGPARHAAVSGDDPDLPAGPDHRPAVQGAASLAASGDRRKRVLVAARSDRGCPRRARGPRRAAGAGAGAVDRIRRRRLRPPGQDGVRGPVDRSACRRPDRSDRSLGLRQDHVHRPGRRPAPTRFRTDPHRRRRPGGDRPIRLAAPDRLRAAGGAAGQ